MAALLKRCEEIYERAKITGDERFWGHVYELDVALGQSLKARPIGDLEITNACARACEKFIEACKEARG